MPNIKHKTITLNGKFMTHDPTTIGTNFRTYTNMRPTADRPKTIAGMTKVSYLPYGTPVTVSNYSFATWTSGDTSAPDDWSFSSTTGSTIAKESTIIKDGSYSAKITNGADVEAYLERAIFSGSEAAQSGKTINFGCWVYCTTASRVKLWIYDAIGASLDTTLSSYHSGSGWEWMTVQRTLRTGALTSIMIRIRIAAGASISAYCDYALVNEDGGYPYTRNAYHFRKFQPAESHVLAQAYNTGLTASQIIDNTTAIPSVGDFSATALFMDSSGAGRGYFSAAPNGQLAYCNGVDTCLWGGSEMPIGAFVTSTSVVDDTGIPEDAKDYTEAMKNTKTDSENVARIGGGIDAYTVLMLHGDGADGSTTITDSSTSSHTVTAVGNAQIDTAYAKFGTGAIKFDGTGDYCTVPDHANWYLGADPFTIDLWWRPSSIAGRQPFCGQYADADNRWYFHATNASPTTVYFEFIVRSGGANKAFYTSHAGYTINIGDWYHIELVRTATNVYIFVNGVANEIDEVTPISTNEVPNLEAVLEVGAHTNHTSVINGHIDEFRITKGKARHTANFSVPSTAYASGQYTFLVGSPRPLQGIKPYIQSGNTTASTLTGKVWIGTTWDTLTLTDNTDTGASLAATGTITFSSTVTTARPKFFSGYFLYWYQFTLDAGEATLYKVTLDAPFQGITDLWDGVFRDILACFKRTAISLEDVTAKAYREDYYRDTWEWAGDLETYVDLSMMDTNGALEIGFPEKMCGIFFKIPEPNGNSVTMTVEYFNGADYVTVGTISDGTSSDGKSLAKSGLVTWDNTSIEDETRTDQVQNGSIFWEQDKYTTEPLYFYKVKFSGTLDLKVFVDYIGGISAVRDINYYKFPIFAQNRLLLCCDMAGDKNKLIVSAKRQAQVFNGQDSIEVYFGEDGELNCGVELFSQYGGNLYSMILIMKDNETWVVAGQDINEWENNIFPLSMFIGCPAPQTLKTIALADQQNGIGKTVAIWQGSNGIYISDGRTPIPIHGDISEYFDRADSRCIKSTLIGNSVAWCDYLNSEYHWKFASGSSATGLNTELVYNWNLGKWYEVNRGVDLQCGVEVVDTDGNPYSYGFIDTGYMERLEYGNTFDGTAITSTLHFGDFPLDDLAYETLIGTVKLLTLAKTTTSNSVTCTLYEDTATSGVDKTMSPAKSGYHLADPYFDEQITGNPFHSLKFVMSTNNETIGFEPLAVIVGYSLTHEQ